MRPSVWLARHAQGAIGALGSLARNPVATGFTVLVIAIALALPAALGVVVQAGRNVAGDWAAARDFSVYLAGGVGLDRAEALARELRGRPSVAAVQVIAADTALAELSEDPAFARAVAALGSNPLPHTLVVRPDSTVTPADLDALAAGIRKSPGVELVKLDLQWVQRLNAILDVVRRLGWLVGSLLVIAVVIIVGNTIRLEIQNRAVEIEVAKLLGATDGFVRRPFLYLGFWYGLLGGLVATVILLAGLWSLRGPVTALAGLYGSGLELGGAGTSALLVLLGGGILAGWAGAWTAVARHLSAIQPKV